MSHRRPSCDRFERDIKTAIWAGADDRIRIVTFSIADSAFVIVK
jgi:hypothetical protein